MACEYCDIISGEKNVSIVYSDDLVVAFMAEQPCTIGHVIITPKKHAPIIEALDDVTSAHLFDVANKISGALFQAIQCEGTNVLVNNGVEAGQETPHVAVNVIARKAGDGVLQEWVPKQAQETELDDLAEKLKQEIETAGVNRADEPPAVADTGSAEKASASSAEGAQKKETEENKEESYLIRQLKRIP